MAFMNRVQCTLIDLEERNRGYLHNSCSCYAIKYDFQLTFCRITPMGSSSAESPDKMRDVAAVAVIENIIDLVAKVLIRLDEMKDIREKSNSLIQMFQTEISMPLSSHKGRFKCRPDVSFPAMKRIAIL